MLRARRARAEARAQAARAAARATVVLAEARADVARADQKASILLAALGIVFGVVFEGQFSGGWSPGDLPFGWQAVWWLAVVASALAIGAAGFAVWPRYRVSAGAPADIRYWGDVAGVADEAQLSAILAARTSTGLERSTAQIWAISRIVLIKYRAVRVALVSAAVASVALSAVVIFGG